MGDEAFDVVGGEETTGGIELEIGNRTVGMDGEGEDRRSSGGDGRRELESQDGFARLWSTVEVKIPSSRENVLDDPSLRSTREGEIGKRGYEQAAPPGKIDRVVGRVFAG